MNAVDPADSGPLHDPVAEASRLIAVAAGQGPLLRVLGGVAGYVLAPDGKRLPRQVKGWGHEEQAEGVGARP